MEEELGVLMEQTKILANYAYTLKGETTDSSQLSQFLDLHLEKRMATNARVTSLKERIKEKNDAIDNERQVWGADREGKKRTVRVTVVVYAEKDGPAEICLKYRASPFILIPLLIGLFSRLQCVMDAVI